MRCEICPSNHGFVAHYYNAKNGTTTWFCSKAHLKRYCLAIDAPAADLAA
jgi:hypothetical protein